MELLSIKQMDNIKNPEGILEYVVQVDFDFKKVITSENGVGIRFVIMKKETEKSGWRIIGIGTGP